ncbi:penicillin acylase family protein [Alkalimonas collagenimarina]|uniref:Penicillin acylase family protein n=1 Tax=Alkalimonas collagenimarina TaxID=400390 RepID=A0ABT9GUY1_9GAMM|nr:penicillin acylase family protein [Alkalimonas collagenimarina]MDP4534855.1 penicillin acylase family protein [Alkalimonas collagenimarina]
MRWLKWILAGLLIVAGVVAISLYGLLRASLPLYQGSVQVAVSDPVSIQRDAQGYAQIHAGNRPDAAYALGFVHAQERFFQMDLLRRNAAGELAALFGKRALSADLQLRQHRFRYRAEQALAQLSLEQLQLLTAYSRGVNDGLQSLTVRPFEYMILRAQPELWREEDSLLTIYSMYLDLQSSLGKDELAMAALAEAIPADWMAFLQQYASEYHAAIDGSNKAAVPMPESLYPDVLKAIKTACLDCTIKDSVDIGSNNFAVGGALTLHGSAMLADDMHLGIRVPGTWFKTQLNWSSGSGEHKVTGLSLPGAPAIVVGSNGHIAWGFTNSTADWHDVIRLQLDDSKSQYKTPAGWQDFDGYEEIIEVKGQPATVIRVKETIWGPVMTGAATQNHSYALRWVGYDIQANNMELVRLEQATTVQQAMAIAPLAGIPAQNLLVADKSGQLGWTIMGPIPEHTLQNWDKPQDWSQPQNQWHGYLTAEQYPNVVNPPEHRLWSANARVVGGDYYALLGNGGYDLGARNWQIKQRLFAKEQFNEQDLHAIQLDHQALMLAPWQQLLLHHLDDDFVQQHQLHAYQTAVFESSDYAAIDAVGYTLVRAFRQKTLELLFAPLSSYLEQRGLRSWDLKYPLATAGWAMIQQQRPDTLPEAFDSWSVLFEQAILQSQAELTQRYGPLSQQNWGRLNQARILHPLASAIPWLGERLNMPSSDLAGDSHMPRVQRPGFGQSQRMVVAPGHEKYGILTIPTGQSGHPLSPFYRADHDFWLQEQPLPFLPGPVKYSLQLLPKH